MSNKIKLYVGLSRDMKEMELTNSEFSVRYVDEMTEQYSYKLDEIIALDTVPRIRPIELDKTIMLWKSRLKQGGKLIVEQPELLKCCANVLRRISAPLDTQVHYVEGLQCLYGYWSPTSLKTDFKWCWEAEALKQVLANCGFVDIKEVPVTLGYQNSHFRLEGTNA